MMDLTYIVMLFFGLALLAHGFYTILKIRKQLHILQLNSYFNGRYFRWLIGKKWQVFHLKELEPLVALVGMFFYKPMIVLVLFILIYFKFILAMRRTEEKKPLVFTPRAIRLFIVSLFFLMSAYLGLIAVWWKFGDLWLQLGLGILVLYNFLIPFLLMLVNLVLSPLERLIQYRYFRKAANYLRTMTNLTSIGITGSFGKTTTKYVLAEILSHKFHTLKTPGSYNTTMGVTKVINSELKPIHELFVVEMSAKKAGDIKELCELVGPKFGLVTSIGEQHLETFKTLENIKNTKNELPESLPPEGVAIFNFDDENCIDLAQRAKCRVISYGINNQEVDYLVSETSMNERGSSFRVTRKSDNSNEVFQISLLGQHNIYNALAAIAVAGELGMALSEMVYPLKKVVPVPHRLELKRLGDGIIYIDDAFNSNPIGSKMALEVLGEISGKRKIIVTPGMIELGPKEDEYNKIFGEHIADVCNYVILVGARQTSALQKGLSAKEYSNDKIFIADEFSEAKEHLESILEAGDVVLFENDLPDNYSDPH